MGKLYFEVLVSTSRCLKLNGSIVLNDQGSLEVRGLNIEAKVRLEM